MKPTQLARLLGISDSTLRLWAREEYTEFLSPSAQSTNGARRSFSDLDCRIIAWIAQLRAQNVHNAEIVNTLRAARSDNWRNLPNLPGALVGDEPVAMIPREAAEERLTAIQERYELQLKTLVNERDALQTQLAETKTDAEHLRAQLAEAHQQIVALSKELASLVRQRRK